MRLCCGTVQISERFPAHLDHFKDRGLQRIKRALFKLKCAPEVADRTLPTRTVHRLHWSACHAMLTGSSAR